MDLAFSCNSIKFVELQKLNMESSKTASDTEKLCTDSLVTLRYADIQRYIWQRFELDHNILISRAVSGH